MVSGLEPTAMHEMSTPPPSSLHAACFSSGCELGVPAFASARASVGGCGGGDR